MDALDVSMEVMTVPAVEILRLVTTVIRDGAIYTKEFAYGSDHDVYERTSCGDMPGRWKLVVGKPWRSFSALTDLVQRMEKKGWTAHWNVNYAPGLQEFKRTVSFV